MRLPRLGATFRETGEWRPTLDGMLRGLDLASRRVTSPRGQVTAELWVAAPSAHSVEELTEPERVRWGRLREQPDRDRFATGALLLRHALRAATGDPTAYLTRGCADCAATDHGIPCPGGRHAGHYGISLSHSEDRVVVAVTKGATAVGVDVERVVHGRLTGIARLVGTAREATADLDADQPDLALSMRWVRKEAILKAAGVGLRVALADLEISDHDEPAYVRQWHSRSCPLRPGPESVVSTSGPAISAPATWARWRCSRRVPLS